MILLIDNYDSFVYNLARYVEELGSIVKVVRNDKITIKEIVNLNPNGIILSPGPCSPNEAGICLDVIQEFYDKIPILGVCLGHQAIGQFFGGEIVRAKKPIYGKTETINHTETGVFKGIPNPTVVMRYHSLIVNMENFVEDLIITSRTKEGEVMAFEHKKYSVYGVQFHPESIMTEFGYDMIKNFLSLTK